MQTGSWFTLETFYIQLTVLGHGLRLSHLVFTHIYLCIHYSLYTATDTFRLAGAEEWMNGVQRQHGRVHVKSAVIRINRRNGSEQTHLQFPIRARHKYIVHERPAILNRYTPHGHGNIGGRERIW